MSCLNEEHWLDEWIGEVVSKSKEKVYTKLASLVFAFMLM